MTPEYVVQKSPTEERFMKYIPFKPLCWITERGLATRYPSKYAAKQQLKLLTEASMDAKVIEL
jgi:hypothetical protein